MSTPQDLQTVARATWGRATAIVLADDAQHVFVDVHHIGFDGVKYYDAEGELPAGHRFPLPDIIEVVQAVGSALGAADAGKGELSAGEHAARIFEGALAMAKTEDELSKLVELLHDTLDNLHSDRARKMGWDTSTGSVAAAEQETQRLSTAQPSSDVEGVWDDRGCDGDELDHRAPRSGALEPDETSGGPRQGTH